MMTRRALSSWHDRLQGQVSWEVNADREHGHEDGQINAGRDPMLRPLAGTEHPVNILGRFGEEKTEQENYPSQNGLRDPGVPIVS